MQLELWTSAFCAPCAAARRVVSEASRLVTGLAVTEHDVAFEIDRADQLDIRSTPTIIVRNASGDQVFRSPGVPTRDQPLVALARAVD
jgi:thioredoxin 1